MASGAGTVPWMPPGRAAVALVMLGAIGPPGSGASLAAEAEGWRSPDDGGPRRLEVRAGGTVARSAPGEGAEVMARYSEGTVLSNMGCMVADGLAWCTVRPFRGGPRAYSLAADLVPAAGPGGVVPMGPDNSRRRADRKDFDAHASIPCAQEAGQSMGRCDAGVARSDGGDATVVATFPNGFARMLYFRNGEFVSASATMSGAGRDIDWAFDGVTHTLRVDDQRYQLANAFVFGP